MKFGSREICNVTFRAKASQTIGETEFKAGQPVLYIDTAKTSTLEGAATSVYATGGRGNTRLITWEGEKTLTFTVEDALLSPISFSMLSGAGLIKGYKDDKGNNKVHVHVTSYAEVDNDGVISLTEALEKGETICSDAPIFVLVTEDGSITGKTLEISSITTKAAEGETAGEHKITLADTANSGSIVLVDYYVLRDGSTVSELQIDAENFAGYYYVEAETLFRRQSDGVDLPAVITIPNVKIQSNFTFSMAATGDPSTFTFTMDAMPGYTYFNQTKKVLCVIQIVEEATAGAGKQSSVMLHKTDEGFDEIEDNAGDDITVNPVASD